MRCCSERESESSSFDIWYFQSMSREQLELWDSILWTTGGGCDGGDDELDLVLVLDGCKVWRGL